MSLKQQNPAFAFAIRSMRHSVYLLIVTSFFGRCCSTALLKPLPFPLRLNPVGKKVLPYAKNSFSRCRARLNPKNFFNDRRPVRQVGFVPCPPLQLLFLRFCFCAVCNSKVTGKLSCKPLYYIIAIQEREPPQLFHGSSCRAKLLNLYRTAQFGTSEGADKT